MVTRHPGRRMPPPWACGRTAPAAPWTGMAEWAHVYEGLFVDEARLSEALAIGDAWMVRADTHGIPPAVESTLSLVRILRDWQAACASESPGLLHRQTVRLALGCAITRMVNDAVEPQQRGAHAAPVHFLASRIGLPRSLVDVRHAATHDALPSLDALLDAAALAVSWLRASYWEPLRAWADAARAAVAREVDAFLAAAFPADMAVSQPGAHSAMRSAYGNPSQLPVDAVQTASVRPDSGLLDRPLHQVASRFLTELPHIEDSAWLQRELARVAADAAAPRHGDCGSAADMRAEALAMFLRAVMAVSEATMYAAVLDACLDAAVLPRLLLLWVSADISGATAAAAAVRCVLAGREDAWAAVAEGARPPAALASLVSLVFRPGAEQTRSVAELSERLASVLPERAGAAGQLLADGYNTIPDWVPTPLGCTASFHPARDYRMLYPFLEPLQ